MLVVHSNVYVGNFHSKKNNKDYLCMYVDLDYTKKVLTFDVNDIAEILGLPVSEVRTRDWSIPEELNFDPDF